MVRATLVLALAALLPLEALAEPLGLAQCRSLREHRDQLAAEAMQAEIALVLSTRRRLCPQLEVLAEQATARATGRDQSGVTASGTGSRTDSGSSAAGAAQHQQGAATNPDQTAQGELDYTAYLQCRRQSEAHLQHARVILYTNLKGFTFYTLKGASLARQADDWQRRLEISCSSAAGG